MCTLCCAELRPDSGRDRGHRDHRRPSGALGRCAGWRDPPARGDRSAGGRARRSRRSPHRSSVSSRVRCSSSARTDCRRRATTASSSATTASTRCSEPSPAEPPAAMLERLEEEIVRFVGGSPSDDLAMFALRRYGVAAMAWDEYFSHRSASLGGLLAGLAATRLFEFIWGRFDDQEPPEPEHREVSWATAGSRVAPAGGDLPLRARPVRSRRADRVLPRHADLARRRAARSDLNHRAGFGFGPAGYLRCKVARTDERSGGQRPNQARCAKGPGRSKAIATTRPSLTL